MINKNFLNEILKTNGFINSYENVESIEDFEPIFEFDNELEFRTDVITSPIDNSYIDPNRTINIFELEQMIKTHLLNNNHEIKETMKKVNDKIEVIYELSNENKTTKSFFEKTFEIENFNQKLVVEKIKLTNSFFYINKL